MHRRNPSQASQPNTPIEMTPLLDVIFIFLFIVMVAMTSAYALKEKELSDWEEQLTNRSEHILQESGLSAAEIDRLSAYDNDYIGERVKFLTISGEYLNAQQRHQRMITILTPDDSSFDGVTFDDNTQEHAYTMLSEFLKKYIEDNSEYAIVIRIDTHLLTKDYDAIERRINEVKEDNTNVF